MASIIILLSYVAVIAPYFIWQHYRQSIRSVYQGKALITMIFKSEFDGNILYAFFQVPGLKAPLMERIPNKYTGDLSKLFTAVNVVVKKRTFGGAWIESIEFEEGHPEPVERLKTEGLLITAYYMFAGLMIAILSASWTFGHVGYFLSASALACAGFCMNRYRFKPSDTVGESRFLGVFKFGKGKTGLIVAGFVLAALTIACFWTPSFLMIFPGITLAFETGGIAALIATARDTGKKATPPAA
ncbi:MAG TPA: hypothetical protein V6C81_02750 [Planktothrix sp.]|jgi:hypothetical protein